MLTYMLSYSCRWGDNMSYNIVEYISKYNKENYKSYQFRVKKSDIDLIERLDSVESKNAYITNLIRRDIDSGILSIKQIKELIKPVVLKHKIKDVYLFGSYARGEANTESDVDIYCSSGDVDTLLKRAGLLREFEEVLGKKVDVVTIGSKLRERFKKNIEEDMIKIC